MVRKSVEASTGKVDFEPSDLIEYGDADKLTRGQIASNRQGDGNYTS
jgi:hypothetical protein